MKTSDRSIAMLVNLTHVENLRRKLGMELSEPFNSIQCEYLKQVSTGGCLLNINKDKRIVPAFRYFLNSYLCDNNSISEKIRFMLPVLAPGVYL